MFKFLGIYKICCIFQILDSNNLLTKKRQKKWLQQCIDQMKKKMYWKIENELSINKNTKSSQTNTFPHCLSMWKKGCEI